MPIARFAFAPGLVLEVTGGPGDVAHLGREYAPVALAAGAGGQAELAVAFGSGHGPVPGGPGAAVRLSSGHKSVGWTVTLSAADDPATSLGIALRGVPRSFARSLVQGYAVEPVLSVVSAEAGWLLLPSAGIVGPDGLCVLIGRSRAGKSTLAARALASGLPIIGDDQVLVDGAGNWRPYPRRLRFYPDLRETAPRAWRALPAATRRVLRLRRAVAALTRGFVRPSLAVEPGRLGARWDPHPRRASRVVLLERSADVAEVVRTTADTDAALAWAGTVLAEQRARLRAVADPAWRARLERVADLEREILRAAITGLPVDVVRIPVGWPASRAVAATERRLGLVP